MKKFFFQAALTMVSFSGAAMAAEHTGSAGGHGVSAGTAVGKVSSIPVAHQPTATSAVFKTPTNNAVSQLGHATDAVSQKSVGHTPNLQAGYVKEHGKSFSHGIFYQGKSQSHWTYQCWSSKYGCECYWCPYTCGYYFWHESSCCYYPVSYYATCCQPSVPVVQAPPVQICSVCPPVVQTQVQTQTQTQTQTQSQSQTAFAGQRPASPVGPPPGVPALPQ